MTSARRGAWRDTIPPIVAAGLLVPAFIHGPGALLRRWFSEYQAPGALAAVVERGVVDLLGAGGAGVLPDSLANAVDYWFWWHAIKIVVCALMVAVLATLAVRLLRRAGAVRSGAGVGGVAVSVLALAATGLLVLNVQATSVPLVALLPLLPDGGSSPELAQVLDATGRDLASPEGSAGLSPGLIELAHHVEQYEWVMVASSGLVVLGLVALATAVGRGAVAGGLPRDVARTSVVVLAVGAALFLAISVTSILAALRPEDALAGLLGIA